MIKSLKTYLWQTRSGTYGFLSALPLFILYEILIVKYNPDSHSMIRVGADIWVKQMLMSVGARDHMVMGLILLVIGALIFFVERKKNIDIKMHYFYWMLIESLFYSIFCAFMVSKAVSVIFIHIPGLILFPLQITPAIAESSFGLQIALSIGAGLYEELFFRVMLVSGLHFIISKFLILKKASYVVAAVIASLIFSGVHYIGSFGDEFTLQSFMFRFIFGLVLNIVYILRGFGIAAWSHSIYDILVTIAMSR